MKTSSFEAFRAWCLPRPFVGPKGTLIPAVPPACRRKGRLMDLVRACDGLFPLPVEEKAASWAWCALAMAFSPSLSRKRPYHGLCAQLSIRVCALAMAFPPCLSRKRPYHGLCVRLRWPLSPVCRGKVRFRAPRCPPERPREVPESGQGAPEPKTSQFWSRPTL